MDAAATVAAARTPSPPLPAGAKHTTLLVNSCAITKFSKVSLITALGKYIMFLLRAGFFFARAPLFHFKPLHKSTLSLLCPTQCDYRKLKREAAGNERPLSPGRQHFSAGRRGGEGGGTGERVGGEAGGVRRSTRGGPPCLLKQPRDSSKFV